MPKTRKSHPPSLKAKVAVEAIKAHKTAAQIAQMFGVHPTQVGGWKKQALAGLPDILDACPVLSGRIKRDPAREPSRRSSPISGTLRPIAFHPLLALACGRQSLGDSSNAKFTITRK
jgi:transposase